MYLSALCKSLLRDYKKPLKHWGVTKTQLRSNKTILLAMKLTAILLLTACLQVSAKTYSQTITLNVQNAPLDKVIKEIEKQTKVNFFYQEGLFQTAKPITISVSKSTLQQTLELCFSGQPFEYKIVQNTVFVKRKEVIKIDQPLADQVDNGDLKGRVLTKEGEPLVSANVINRRTGKGTTTDANGNFILNDVNKDDIVQITYTGYAPRSIKVSEFATVTFVLETANNELDQVVMQAYGTTTRRLATGNIAKVTSEEISKQPVINPLQALQGRVPGLVVTQTSGYASAPFKVELRGRNTIGASFTSDPLYIIDGVPLTILEIGGNSGYTNGSTGFIQNGFSGPASGQSPLFSLNPSDIESIEVLKDADATAIYGSRAANGVILITTKKGKAGKSIFTINITQGISKVTRFWDMLNTEQYLAMRKEAFTNDNIVMNTGNAPDILIWDSNRNVNWQKELWGGSGKTTNLQLSLSGGDPRTSFRIGAGYTRTTNILTIKGADQRSSFSFNLNHSALQNKLILSLTTNFSYSESDMINLPSIAQLAPNAPAIYNDSSYLNYHGWSPVRNFFPFASLLQPYTSKTKFLSSNLLIKYQITKQINFKTSLGYNDGHANQIRLQPIISLDPNTSPKGTAQFGNNFNKGWIIEPQLEYNSLIFSGRFNVLFGGSIQSTTTDGLYIQGQGYASDALLRSVSNAPNKFATENYGEYRYAALFARIGYSWKDKYIFNFNGRRDGSSRFGLDSQFGNFGSVGLAWIFTEENWMKKLNFLSFGKLRVSYGTTGGDNVNDYQYLPLWSASALVPTYTGISSLIPINHANPSFHWQVNKKFEGALDLGLFENRFYLSTAYYRNRCDNQLVGYILPSYTGFTSVTANLPALVQNSGLEVSVAAKIIEGKNFRWSINANISFNRNKLVSYPDLDISPYKNVLIIGKSINVIKLLHYTGIDPNNGLYTFEDKNGDTLINANPNSPLNDLYPYDKSPKYSGGFGSSLKYKNLDLSFWCTYIKQIGINAYSGVVPGKMGNAMSNMPVEVFNRWQKFGDITNIARFTTLSRTEDVNFSQSSNGIYTDASFIRLANVSLTYQLPENIIKKAHMKTCNIYIQVQNPFVITNYKGIDPETQNFGSMPPAKVYTAGVQFNF
jgi:TonB-linked SusC/RagA family outer membrane protein